MRENEKVINAESIQLWPLTQDASLYVEEAESGWPGWRLLSLSQTSPQSLDDRFRKDVSCIYLTCEGFASLFV